MTENRALDQVRMFFGQRIEEVYAGLGCRVHEEKGSAVYILGQKHGVTVRF